MTDLKNWKLVPRELTEAMCSASMSLIKLGDHHIQYPSESESYEAMLAAAPQPPRIGSAYAQSRAYAVADAK